MAMAVSKLNSDIRSLRDELAQLDWLEVDSRLKRILAPLLQSEGYRVEREVGDLHRIDRLFYGEKRYPSEVIGEDGIVRRRVLRVSDRRPPDLIARRTATSDCDALDLTVLFKHSVNLREVPKKMVREALSQAAERKAGRALVVSTTPLPKAIARIAHNTYPIELQFLDLEDIGVWAADLATKDDDTSTTILKAIYEFSQELAHAIARDESGLSHIEWRDLERLLATIFKRLGFDVELTPPSKDKGRDLILKCRVFGERRSYVVEAKHWKSGKRVGLEPVRRFVSVVAHENHDGGLILSSSGFSLGAYEALTEFERVEVQLGDRRKIASLCHTYVKAGRGLWSPPRSLVDVIFDDNEHRGSMPRGS